MHVDFGWLQNLIIYDIGLLAVLAIGYVLGLIQATVWGREGKKRSLNFKRGVLKGMVSEQLAFLRKYLTNSSNC